MLCKIGFRQQVLAILVGMAGTAFGDLPVASRGDLRFFVETAGFRGPEGYTRQEFYLLIDAWQLGFESDRRRQVGEVEIAAVVSDSAGMVVAERKWTRRVSIDSLDALAEASAPFRDATGFDLKPGRYQGRVEILDVKTGKAGQIKQVFHAKDFEGKGLIFSDLQCASGIERSAASDRFSKQGWKVLPNPTRHYVVGQPLSIYFELYNFSLDTSENNDSFIIGYSMIDSSGQDVRRYPARRVLKPGESCAITEILETEGLQAGAYYLQVEAFDGYTREYVQARRRVFLASAQRQPAALTQLQQNLLRYFADIRHVADEQTLRAYNELLDWPSRLQFLQNFWKSLDPNPDTVDNERLLEHLLRMSYVENRFSQGRGKRGADTDRGRTYIRYGAPDDIDYHMSAAGQKPYEVWIYEKRGRYEFVFRDRRGNGIYELVHSTYPGELYNPYWNREL